MLKKHFHEFFTRRKADNNWINLQGFKLSCPTKMNAIYNEGFNNRKKQGRD